MKRCTVYDFQTVPAICKRRYIDELGLFLCLDMISYYVTNRYSCCCRVERLQLNPNVSKLHHVTLARHKFVRPAPRVKFATKRSQQRWLHRVIPTIKPRIRVKQTFVCRPSYCRSSEFFLFNA